MLSLARRWVFLIALLLIASSASAHKALRNGVKKYSPDAVDVGIVSRRLYDEENSGWEVVKKYLDECVFVLKDPDAEADGGKFESE